jgi:hypothetical protein
MIILATVFGWQLGVFVGDLTPGSLSWGAIVGGAVGAVSTLALAIQSRGWLGQLTPTSAKVKLLGQEVTLKVDEATRRAAWRLWVEYRSRITTESLGAEEGILREALNSLYSLFQTTRDALNEAGPSSARNTEKYPALSLAECSLLILNEHLRPVLSRWHPLLEAHEATREKDASVAEHEKAWAHTKALRAELEALREPLDQWINELLRIAQPSAKRAKAV